MVRSDRGGFWSNSINTLLVSIYTPYSLKYPLSPPQQKSKDGIDKQKTTTVLPEIFLFDYGVVVFWGMTFQEEQRILKELEPYEDAKLGIELTRIQCLL